MAEKIIVARSFTGLNNRADPTRLRYDRETGVTELAQATNINIDNDNRAARRKGYEELTILPGGSPSNYHSLYAEDNIGFAVGQPGTGDILYYISALASDTIYLSSLKTGLQESAKLSYAKMGTQVFWGNGYQCGVIRVEGLVSNGDWIASVGYSGPLGYDAETGEGIDSWASTHERERGLYAVFRKPYESPHLVTVISGYVFIACDNVVYWCMPRLPFHWRYGKDRADFPTRVSLLVAVDDGLYISDQTTLYWCPISVGERGLELKAVRLHNNPAVEGAYTYESFEASRVPEFLELGLRGRIRAWVANRGTHGQPGGIFMGGSGGVVINATIEKLDFQRASDGCLVVHKERIIASQF